MLIKTIRKTTRFTEERESNRYEDIFPTTVRTDVIAVKRVYGILRNNVASFVLSAENKVTSKDIAGGSNKVHNINPNNKLCVLV